VEKSRQRGDSRRLQRRNKAVMIAPGAVQESDDDYVEYRINQIR
jgi:hypothetical protein